MHNLEITPSATKTLKSVQISQTSQNQSSALIINKLHLNQKILILLKIKISKQKKQMLTNSKVQLLIKVLMKITDPKIRVMITFQPVSKEQLMMLKLFQKMLMEMNSKMINIYQFLGAMNNFKQMSKHNIMIIINLLKAVLQIVMSLHKISMKVNFNNLIILLKMLIKLVKISQMNKILLVQHKMILI